MTENIQKYLLAFLASLAAGLPDRDFEDLDCLWDKLSSEEVKFINEIEMLHGLNSASSIKDWMQVINQVLRPN